VRQRRFGDEKLRAVGVGTGVGHRETSGAIEEEVGVQFIFEMVAGPAGSRSQRIAALDHESRNDPVKDDAVVERAVVLYLVGARICPRLLPGREADEVSRGFGGWVGEQLASEIPERRVDDGGGMDRSVGA